MSRISSGMRPGGSSMKQGSSSTLSGMTGKQLPLIECPRCGVRVVKIRSKQPQSYDEMFFKCPNSINVSWMIVQFVFVSSISPQFLLNGIAKIWLVTERPKYMSIYQD
jgi:DNA-directed RNA polymerase subunit RPC12/RpoP